MLSKPTAFGLLGVFLGLVSAPLDAEVPLTLRVVEGNATVSNPTTGETKTLTAVDGSLSLEPCLQVRVGSTGLVKLEGEGVEAQLRSGSEFEQPCDSASDATTEQKVTLGVRLQFLIGALKLWLDPDRSGDERYEVVTTSGTAAVKGTELIVEVQPDQTAVFEVTRGSVELSNAIFGLEADLESHDAVTTLWHTGVETEGHYRDDVLRLTTSEEAEVPFAMAFGETELEADPGSALKFSLDDDGEMQITVERGIATLIASGQVLGSAAGAAVSATVPAAGAAAATTAAATSVAAAAGAAAGAAGAVTTIANELDDEGDITTSPGTPK